MKNGFLKVFLNECKKLFWQSPKRLFYVLLLPMMLFSFLAALFMQGVPTDMPVAYLDNDQTEVSSKLIRMLDSSSAIEMALPVISDSEAKMLMQRGDIYAYIKIPNNFQKGIFQGLSQEVVLYTNNQYLMPAGLIQKDFQTVIGTFAAGVRMNKSTQSGVQPELALAQQVPVRTDIHVLFNPYTNYAFYLLVLLLPVVLHMVSMMITVYVIGLPLKKQEGLLWLEQAGNNSWSALWGKLLPYTLCLAFVSWWMNYLLFVLIDVPTKTSLVSLTLITFLMVFIYQLIGIVLVSIAKELRVAMTLGSGITAIVISFAAYTFPIEGLPKSMQYLSQIFPFKHFTNYYINRGIRGIPIEQTLAPIITLASFVLLFVLAYPKFVKLLNKGGYE